VLPKTHATVLAAGKNTSLLGMLEQIEWKSRLLWWLVVSERATNEQRLGVVASQKQMTVFSAASVRRLWDRNSTNGNEFPA